MSHTIGCYVDDGLEVVTAGYSEWSGPGDLPIAPWSWGHQDSLYAFLAPPGKSPLAGADAPVAPPATTPSATRLVLGAGAVLVGGFLLKFAYDAAQGYRGVEREPLPQRYAAPRRSAQEPWHVPEDELGMYGPAVQRAKDELARRRLGRAAADKAREEAWR